MAPTLALLQRLNTRYSMRFVIIGAPFESAAAENLMAGLNDVENNFTSVYPNPTANELTIVAELGGISVSIVDMLGNTVEQLNLTEGINQISVRSLVSGTYFIVDASNHRTARFSVIK